MDEPYHEETYEDLITPSFFSLERDTLHMVEVITRQLSSLTLLHMRESTAKLITLLSCRRGRSTVRW